ncbi:OmpA family protein [Bacteroidota bacterium]
MHPDGVTMYFSSKGLNTMGGYDIFKTELKGDEWTKPENIGYPINSPDNDVYFVLSASGKHGYYSSAKIGGYGGQDIYRITFLGPEKPLINNTEDNLIASAELPLSEKVTEKLIHIKTNQVTIVKGTIFDDLIDEPIKVKGIIEITDNELGEVIYSATPNSSTSKYLFTLPSGKNYGIAFKAEGFLFHSENFDIPASTEFQEIIKDIYLQRIEVGSKIILNNIFFDFDRSTLRPESTSELNRIIELLNEYPTVRIEISGHTDSKGTEEYNVSLALRRAQSVVKYLVQHGISADRFEAKGYGETSPIAPNVTPTGTDFPKGRQMNRRCEFQIISL